MTYSWKTDSLPVLATVLELSEVSSMEKSSGESADSYAKMLNDRQKAISNSRARNWSLNSPVTDSLLSAGNGIYSGFKDGLGRFGNLFGDSATSKIPEIANKVKSESDRLGAKDKAKAEQELGWLKPPDNASSKGVVSSSATGQNILGSMVNNKSVQGRTIIGPDGGLYSSSDKKMLMSPEQFSDFKVKNKIPGNVDSFQFDKILANTPQARSSLAVRMMNNGDTRDAAFNRSMRVADRFRGNPVAARAAMDVATGTTAGAHTTKAIGDYGESKGYLSKMKDGLSDPNSPYFNPEFAARTAFGITNPNLTDDQKKLHDQNATALAKDTYINNTLKEINPNYGKTMPVDTAKERKQSVDTMNMLSRPSGFSDNPYTKDRLTQTRNIISNAGGTQKQSIKPPVEKQNPVDTAPKGPYTVDKDEFAKRIKAGVDATPTSSDNNYTAISKPTKHSSNPVNTYDRI